MQPVAHRHARRRAARAQAGAVSRRRDISGACTRSRLLSSVSATALRCSRSRIDTRGEGPRRRFRCAQQNQRARAARSLGASLRQIGVSARLPPARDWRCVEMRPRPEKSACATEPTAASRSQGGRDCGCAQLQLPCCSSREEHNGLRDGLTRRAQWISRRRRAAVALRASRGEASAGSTAARTRRI